MRTRERGHTLIELLMVCAIATLVSLLAFPDLGLFLAEQRAVARANQLVATVRLAHSVAATRNRPVRLCPGTGWRACRSGFELGYTVFVDADDNAVLDSNDEVLVEQGPLDPVRILGNRDGFRFRPAGRVTNGTLTVCGGDPAGRAARAVVVAPNGRPRITQRTSAGKPLDCSG